MQRVLLFAPDAERAVRLLERVSWLEKAPGLKPNETRNSVWAKKKLLSLNLSSSRPFKRQAKEKGHAVLCRPFTNILLMILFINEKRLL